jgi:hypothetical protein
MNSIRFTKSEIVAMYAHAMEDETGIPLHDLEEVFDYDSYRFEYDSRRDVEIVTLLNVRVQFEYETDQLRMINHGCGSGWQLAF